VAKTRVIEEMQQIRKLRLLGLHRDQIMKQMNLSRHCYENRVKKINMIDHEYIMNSFANEVATEIMQLRERLLSTLRMSERIATSDEEEVATRLEAERLKIDCSIALVKLLNEGPQVLKSSELGRAIMSREQKLLLR
jgi:hypothetical protein